LVLALTVFSKYQTADENGRCKLAMAGLATVVPVRGYRLPVLKTDRPIPSRSSTSLLRMTLSPDNLFFWGAGLVIVVLPLQERLMLSAGAAAGKQLNQRNREWGGTEFRH